MGMFDGTGSFGLGLGGMDISDYMGMTGTGGLGTVNMNPYGGGLESTQLDNFTPQTNMTGQPTFKSDVGISNDVLKAGNISPSNAGSALGNYGQQNTGGTNWMDSFAKYGALAYGIYDKETDRKDKRTSYNNQIEKQEQNDDRNKSLNSKITANTTPYRSANYERL